MITSYQKDSIMSDKSLFGALPTCIESERILLGSLLLDSDMFPEIVERLKPSDFSLSEHTLIFNAMKECFNQFKHFNVQKIHEYLITQGVASKVDITVLMKLEEMSAPSMSLKDYATLIKRTSSSRSKIEGIHELASILKKVNDPELENKARAILENLLKSDGISEPSDFKPFTIALKEALERIMSPMTNKCSTSFQPLDQLIGGFYNKELVIIGARPSMGKTAFIVTIMKNLMLAGVRVGFYSAEMSRVNIVIRILSQLSGIPFRKIRDWTVNPEEEATFLSLFDNKTIQDALYIDEKTRNINELKREARKLKNDHQVDVIFIDYLQRLSSGSRRMDYTEVTYISSELKSLATELDIPIVCLSQLNRSVESRMDKRPMMSDLKESGGIEQDADTIILLYRDEYYNPDTQTPGVLEVIVPKNRNDSVGKVDLYFNKTTMEFVQNPWNANN